MAEIDLEALARKVADKICYEAMCGPAGYMDIAKAIVFALVEYDKARARLMEGEGENA